MKSADTALVIVDIQLDFLPGGALGVETGYEILEPLRRLMRSDRFPIQVATQDWHPAGHTSFASAHEGRKPFDVIDLYGHEQVLWPDHCVRGSPGASFHPDLPWERIDAIVRKGTDPLVDSYSGFRNNWNAEGERPPTGLGGFLRERGVEEVWIAGLARDYCVLWSAEDAAAAGFRTFFLWDLTRPVDPSADETVRARLREANVQIT